MTDFAYFIRQYQHHLDQSRELYDKAAKIWAKIPSEIQAEIKAFHEEAYCDASNEGVECCLEILDGDAQAALIFTIEDLEKRKNDQDSHC